MKSNTNIFTQASLKSTLRVVTAIIVVMIITILASNSELLMTSAHAIPNTTIITPSVEDVVEESGIDVANTNATNSAENNGDIESAGLATDMFDAHQNDSIIQPPVKTLADNIQVHSESELSQANQNLLTDNAKLQREINDLETQVNVLVAERGGQLFLYGAGTALASFIIGGLFALLLFGRRRDSRY